MTFAGMHNQPCRRSQQHSPPYAKNKPVKRHMIVERNFSIPKRATKKNVFMEVFRFARRKGKNTYLLRPKSDSSQNRQVKFSGPFDMFTNIKNIGYHYAPIIVGANLLLMGIPSSIYFGFFTLTPSIA